MGSARVILIAAAFAASATCIFAVEVAVSPSCTLDGNCTALIRQSIAQCTAASPSCTILFRGGAEYVLEQPTLQPTTAFYFGGLRNVRVAGDDSETRPAVLNATWLTSLFVFGECTNVTVANIQTDMVRPPFTLGFSVATTPQGATILSVPDQSLYPVNAAAVARFPYLGQAQAVIGYLPTVEQYTGPDIYVTGEVPVTYTQDATSGNWSMTVPHALAMGSWFVVRHQVYVFNTLTFMDTDGVVVANVTLYGGGGMGLIILSCRNIRVDRYRTLRRRFDDGRVRAMSITADGIHICNTQGGSVSITRSILEGQGDDGLNINTNFGRVGVISKDRKSIYIDHNVTRYPPSAQIFAGLFGRTAAIDVFDGQTMVVKGTTPAVVGIDATQGRVDFESPLDENVIPFDLITNANGFAESTLVEDTLFLNNRARGALLKQPNLVARRNTFSGMTSPAIITEVDGCYWMEGRPIYNWTVTDNDFTNLDAWGPFQLLHIRALVPVFSNGVPTATCASVSDRTVFRNLTISGNRFNWSLQRFPFSAAVKVYAGTGIDVSRNQVTRSVTGGQGADFAFTVGCADVTCIGNACRDDGSGSTGCRVLRNASFDEESVKTGLGYHVFGV